ncbi:uncharacterized protein LOC110459472 [Mizuhopecten yessoensis]|uniref:WAP domain-containing protein n=1 Tax=Mizuhopecten yessoensis TaxID=6573 RepID=A0A210Q4G8_MIZYE|nr:uncharacterized protein LOC110459472 [Mizuhopecten yessoensis]OWF43622.1 hypothetical protein KP79_PYT22320 [Mizuhopecten yessoensis]
MNMDVPFLVSLLVAMHVCGVMAMSPLMQDMNADIMRDITNLRKKIKNHQKTLSDKGNGSERSSILPAAEIGIREFFPSSEGILPVDTQESGKRKSQTSITSASKTNVNIPEVPNTLKSPGVSDKGISPIEKKLEKPKTSTKRKLKKSSKKSPSTQTTETKSKDASPIKTAQDPSIKQETIIGGVTDVTVTTKSASRSTRRSRRKSSSKRKSSRRSRRKTTPAPGTATQSTLTTDIPTEPTVANVQTTPTPNVVLEPTPKRSIQTTMSHILSDGPMAISSILAQLYPQILGLLGRVRSQRPLMHPSMAVLVNEGRFFNPSIPGPILGQGHIAKQAGPSTQGSLKTSSPKLKTDRAGKTFAQRRAMQIYMQQELCSDTPSRFIKRCRTTKDCQQKMECYSGYCCANSHRHAEMLDNMPEYIEIPRRQRWWSLRRRVNH